MAYSKQTWYDLPNTSTPINSERLNHMEDGIYQNSIDVENKIIDEYSTGANKGYSCDYVNELVTYSTTEKQTGIYDDGKPVYTKMYTGSLNIQQTSSSTNIFTLPENFKNIIDISGTFTWGTYTQPFPFVWGTDSCALRRVGNNLHYYSTIAIGSGTYIIFVKYTKTTD